MAKISELADGGNLLNDDELIVLRAGGNVRATVANLPEVDASGNQSFADNEKATFGTGNDLQIYHDGSNSIITDQGTGNLKINASSFEVNNFNDTQNILDGNAAGAVKLYHAGLQKLTTTSTGIDVTGSVSADGLVVDGGGTFRVDASATTDFFTIAQGGTQAVLTADSPDGAGNMVFRTASSGVDSDRLRIATNGDVSLYENTGTTAKFFWDASAERLGIGTSSPGGLLAAHTGTDSSDILALSGGNSGRFLKVQSFASGAGFSLDATSSEGVIALKTAGTERARVTNDGKVGIGTSSPSSTLHLFAANPTITFQEGAGSTSISGDAANLEYTVPSGKSHIFSGGNVGIGTSNPQGPLQVHLSSARNLVVDFDTEGDSRTSLRSIEDTANNLRPIQIEGQEIILGTAAFDQTVSAEAMRIDSSGSVGIGTASPATTLTVEGSSANGIELNRNGADATSSARLFFDSSTNCSSIFNSGGNFVIATGATPGSASGTERMRIDSSGNLLVGKTSADQFTVAGHELHEDGLYVATRDGGNVVVLNRETSDGSVLQFRKDNVTVGNIGAGSGDLNIYSAVTNHNGLRLGEGYVAPTNDFGNAVDADADLGLSSHRFKDLYLSGGTYLGGTAAANKLDDYEEGTWTPTVVGTSTAGTATYTTQYGKYTKVGNIVFIQLYVEYSSHTGTGNMEITGLPFTAYSQAGLSIGDAANLTVPANTVCKAITVFNTTNVRFRTNSTTSGLYSDSNLALDAAATINVSGVYRID